MRRVVLMVDDKMNKNELREEAKGRNKGKRRLTADAKRAMAEGRERSRTIDLYLKSLETHKYQRRTVVVDRKDIEAKIKEIDAEITDAVGVNKLLLAQSRRDLENQLNSQSSADEFAHLEAAFISVAKQFSIEREISYETWRDLGVPMRTLAKAGIYPPSSRRKPLPDPKDQR